MLCIQSHGSLIYSFRYLNFIVQTKPGKDCQSAEQQTDAITGKDENKGKGTCCILSRTFDTPEGRCGIQQSLTVGLRDQVAQLLKDGEL